MRAGVEPCGWQWKMALPSPWPDAASSRRSYPRREEDAEAIRCHVEQCERCYPMYNWERLFLDVLKERGGRPEPSDELR